MAVHDSHHMQSLHICAMHASYAFVLTGAAHTLAGMFVYIPSTNVAWFNRASPRDADRDFELIGK